MPCQSLVSFQPSDYICHRLVSVDLESLLFRHAGELDILGVQLLFHNLLQGFQHEHFRFFQGQ